MAEWERGETRPVRVCRERIKALFGVSFDEGAVIAQIEDDDFEGDSLVLLQRIAAALNKTVEIRVVARRARRRAA